MGVPMLKSEEIHMSKKTKPDAPPAAAERPERPEPNAPDARHPEPANERRAQWVELVTGKRIRDNG
jgi:hypothetical protein